MTIHQLHDQLEKQTPFLVEEIVRYNQIMLRIGFTVLNTNWNGQDIYQDEILQYIPSDFNYVIQPNCDGEGEEIIIYESIKNKNMKKVTLSNDGESVLIDGVVYEKKKEPEQKIGLKTFDDCWEEVKPQYWNHSFDYGVSDHGIHNIKGAGAMLQLPTEKTAKQIKAAIKLFVVRHALQGGWEPSSGDDPHYIWFNGVMGLQVAAYFGKAMPTPFVFKSEELAKKSIEIASDIYKEWFGVKDSEMVSNPQF